MKRYFAIKYCLFFGCGNFIQKQPIGKEDTCQSTSYHNCNHCPKNGINPLGNYRRNDCRKGNNHDNHFRQSDVSFHCSFHDVSSYIFMFAGTFWSYRSSSFLLYHILTFCINIAIYTTLILQLKFHLVLILLWFLLFLLYLWFRLMTNLFFLYFEV